MLSIFTPTYNRAYSLPRLYESLVGQTFDDFEWIIVDDGSTDDTELVCHGFIEEGRLRVTYRKVPNGGKHSAINVGAQLACGEWFFIVDSDDWLVPDGLETTSRYLEQIVDDERFAGVSGLRGFPDGTINFGPHEEGFELSDRERELLRHEYVDATTATYHYRMKIRGDRAEVVRTDLVRSHPLPVFEGETFLPETPLWLGLSNEGYLLRWFNQITYLGDYLEDGLTSHLAASSKRCWRGSAYINDFLASSRLPLVYRLSGSASYFRYGFYGAGGVSLREARRLFAASSNKALAPLGLGLALMFPVK